MREQIKILVALQRIETEAAALASDLAAVPVRIATLERLFNLRAGFKADDDTLPVDDRSSAAIEALQVAVEAETAGLQALRKLVQQLLCIEHLARLRSAAYGLFIPISAVRLTWACTTICPRLTVPYLAEE